ncbi:uncharacterized protein DNG_00735 [Cephalotrichum gorgonifer]|uniref:ER-bound oxygenase mpaB/mpaB'/Rubber oxygenase catalytic domain-containing protein n=1 Tax=Cephalotrichum gorgonifer TaxID=2041049 RepID=A0AAE8MQG5_9PEZI|nr:uncharacterized protein DNG_00735 [Cephalotrichum gorgonifer]
MSNTAALVVGIPLLAYLYIVRRRRYARAHKISRGFASRPLSSMTLKEAYAIIEELQTLEFPTAFDKARAYALLKTGGIPTISKLLMATGQSSEKNAPKRAVDTNIILMETQTNDVDSDRHFRAVARMNYLHERYRKAGKILDEDMLHTLGSGMAEIIRFVDDYEWRRLSDVEVCALGVWHRALGDAMKIPYTALPSHEEGWADGLQFARELERWVGEYEARVAVNTPSNSAFVSRYIESKIGKVRPALKPLLKRALAADLDDTMRKSMGLQEPGLLLKCVVRLIQTGRWLALRYVRLPRPETQPRRHLQEKPDPDSGLYNFRHGYVEPWYLSPGHRRQVDPERYRGKGYSLDTVGPLPQEGKGVEEMDATVEVLRNLEGRGCPFGHGKGSSL